MTEEDRSSRNITLFFRLGQLSQISELKVSQHFEGTRPLPACFMQVSLTLHP
jgi:hypothetical protein